MKKAIVIGSNGFVGSALIEVLIKNNIDVLAVSRNMSNEVQLKTKNNNLFNFIILDQARISELPTLIQKLKWEVGPECVFYNFAWSGENRLMDGSIEIQLMNVSHLANSVKVASLLGCKKFINPGSIEESFAENYLSSKWGLGEFNSNNAYYAVSKIASKNMSKLMGYLYKIDYVHTRFSAALDSKLTNGGYISRVFSKILSGEINYDKSLNKNLFDLIDLDDLADAYYLIGLYGKNKSDYFIGSGNPQMLEDYFENLIHYKTHRKMLPSKNYPNSNQFNSTLLLKDTGLNMATSFDKLIKKIIY